MRECPTRADGTEALFAHVISPATCQDRQRQHYHKCPTCAFYNARVSTPSVAAIRNGVVAPATAASSNGASGNGHVANAEAPTRAAEAPLAPAAQKPS
jgi:hypothetical protein